MVKRATALSLVFLFQAQQAFAIQEHGDPEGFFVHQLAHLVFIAAMVFMFVVLRKPAVSRLTGWRYVRYASLFLLLWNVDTFLSHIASYRMEPKEAYINGSVLMLRDFAARFYFFSSLAEYFFLVPGFIFLAIGLNQLFKHIEKEGRA